MTRNDTVMDTYRPRNRASAAYEAQAREDRLEAREMARNAAMRDLTRRGARHAKWARYEALADSAN